jgi:hypothetical protein
LLALHRMTSWLQLAMNLQNSSTQKKEEGRRRRKKKSRRRKSGVEPKKRFLSN